MNRETIYSMNTAFRGEYEINGYTFGSGEKAACIVGSMRGNEYQQLYMCARLVSKLTELEDRGAIVANKEILVIPSLNHSSMNIGGKFWVSDNSDLNREFPGNPKGQASSRIAAAIMERVKGYNYGIQFPSFYLQGEFIPHIRMMETGLQSNSLANLFGLPYVVTGSERAYNTTTLNYNWQINGTSAFSIYTGATDEIDEERAQIGVSAVLRFLTRMGIIRYNCHGGYISSILDEEDMVSIQSSKAGFLRKLIGTNEEVKRGYVLAEVIEPNLGTVVAEIVAPTDGIIFYVQDARLYLKIQ